MVQQDVDLNPERTATQLAEIRYWFEDGGALTSLDAWRLFGCSRLAARVHTLRKQGLLITSRIIRVPTASGRAARIAEYRLSAGE